MPSPPFLSIALASFLLLSACRDGATDKGEKERTAVTAITIRDAVGETVTLAGPARRVISLAPNITEILFALGAGEQTIGRTTYCSWPPEASRIPSVGDMMTVDYERIVGLRPDLALMSVAAQTGEGPYRKLRALGIPTAALGAETVEGTIRSIDTIGRLVGREAEAARITAAMRATVDSVRRDAAEGGRTRVFVVIDKKPLMTVSGGFIGEMVEIAGGENVAAGGAVAYPTWPRERLLRDDPDVIILPGTDSTEVGALLDLYPEMRDLRAVRTGRIHFLPTELVTRPGPRMVEGIRMLRRVMRAER